MENEFVCRAPDCGRSFTTSTGRGLHERRGHPNWCDARKLEASAPKKDRWTDEERDLLARKEAEIQHSAVGRVFMNQELLKFFKDRTLESIKGQRKTTRHKDKVHEYLEELSRQPSSPSSTDSFHSAEDSVLEEDPICPLTSWLREEGPLNLEGYDASKLNTIISKTAYKSREEISLELAFFLREAFPARSLINSNIRTPRTDMRPKSNKQKRRADFARAQDMWRRNMSHCAKRILDDQMDQEITLEREVMEPYWRTVFTKHNDSVPELPEPKEILHNLWRPIQPKEIKVAFPPANTATGPDGIKVKDLKSLPLLAWVRIFNLFMWTGRLPDYLCTSRTVLIPKKKCANEPGQFRPITVSSVIVRTFHKILANRLKVIKLDSRQRAFISADGCAENTILLDMALKYHQKKSKKLFVAILDMAKAFDSVTFPALLKTMSTKGIPRQMYEYIMNTYHRSSTVIQHGDWTSQKISPTCGVKQGDPLSPMLFNFVVDEMLKKINPDIGINLDGMKISILAFADDLVLMASSKIGLQTMIDQVAEYLTKVGLEANACKCATIAIQTIPRAKQTAVDPNCRFTIRGVLMPALKRTDEWRYLGLQFTAGGRVKQNDSVQLIEYLDRLTKAPLKPQQRLWVLRTILIPRLMYQLVLGDTSFGHLRSVDKKIRIYVRKWLHLPHETPNGYIHAAIKDGGLGVHSIRWNAPAYRARRLESLLRSNYVVGPVAGCYIEREKSIAERRIRDNHNSILSSPKQIEAFWAECLYNTFDGAPLKDSRKVPVQHKWIGEPTKFLSGKDFVNSCKARINALPTLSRTSRGRVRDRDCRGGCGKTETLNHILQHCHRTHDIRIRRHDAVLKVIDKNLVTSGFNIEREPRIRCENGVAKPDRVATIGKTSIVLDAQVVSDQFSVDAANEWKVGKYASNTSMLQEIRTRFGSDTTLVIAVTLNWRGVWSSKSVEELKRRGLLKNQDIKIISSRTLIGGVAAFNKFNRTTTVSSRTR